MAKNNLDRAYTEYKEKFNELKAKAEDLIATKSSTFSSSIDVNDSATSSEDLCKYLCKEFPQLRFTLVFESGKRKIAFQPYMSTELVKGSTMHESYYEDSLASIQKTVDLFDRAEFVTVAVLSYARGHMDQSSRVAALRQELKHLKERSDLGNYPMIPPPWMMFGPRGPFG